MEKTYLSQKVQLNTRVYQIALPWIMWSFGALFYFYEFLVQVSPNVMGIAFMKDFSVTANRLGILSGVYFYAYALMQIPAGIFLDRLGPHRLLAMASLIVGIGCLLFSHAQNFSLALFARFSIGVGSAFAVIGCMKIAANWFPHTRFALVIGLTVAVGMLGAVMGEAPLAKLIEKYSWRDIMFFLSIVGGIFCFFFIVAVRDHPTNKQIFTQNISSIINIKLVIIGLKQVIRSTQSWLVALYGLLMFAPTITLCGLWGTPFLKIKYSFNHEEATSLITIIFIGWLIGSPLGGWISDYLRKRLPTMIIGSIGAFICLLAIIYGSSYSTFALANLMLFFGIFSSGFLTSFSIIRENSPESVSASALGFMNMMNTLGIAITQPLVGFVLDFLWEGRMFDQIRQYTLLEYQMALAVLPIMLLLAIFLLPFIKETYCKPKSC